MQIMSQDLRREASAPKVEVRWLKLRIVTSIPRISLS
jgi:hypothetical protein